MASVLAGHLRGDITGTKPIEPPSKVPRTGNAGVQEVVVVGAGIIGLSTAIRLLEAGCRVTVVAKSYEDTCSHSAASWFIPDPEYGTGHGSTAQGFHGELYQRWARRTYEVMAADMSERSSATQLLKGYRLYTKQGAADGMQPIVSGPRSLAQFVPSFRELKAHDAEWTGIDVASGNKDLGDDNGVIGGTTFRTLLTSMAPYLEQLRERIKKAGGALTTQEIKSLKDVAEAHPKAECIVNCTGMGTALLDEVCDSTMIPVRGQTVLVRAPKQTEFFSLVSGSKQFPVYVIPQGDGTVILGGSKVPGDLKPEPDPELAARIIRQASAWCPALRDHEVIRHNVGWRPFRGDGVRLELDQTAIGPQVVHNYGHGDVGVILAWGCAEDVVKLVCLKTLSNDPCL